MPRDANPTAAPRPGEELDAAALAAWLRTAAPGCEGPVTVEQFPAGHSNLTYLVRAGGGEYVLRRPPFGTTVKSAHDMGREFRVLSKLHPVYPPAPRPVAYCEDPAVIGAPFYLMERLRGQVIRTRLPEALAGQPERCRALSHAVIDNLAALHGLNLEAAGLAGFGKPEGYVRRQIEGWSRRWMDALTGDVPEMTATADWLAARMPAESGAALIHNDYKLDNLLVDAADPTRISGVLDWEMATVGDPLLDLGTALSYWIEAADPAAFQQLRFSPTVAPGFVTRSEFLARYQDASGREVRDPVYYYVYGLFKLAVILQQIYYRWAKGLTQDARFAAFGGTVRGLARRATAAIETGRL